MNCCLVVRSLTWLLLLYFFVTTSHFDWCEITLLHICSTNSSVITININKHSAATLFNQTTPNRKDLVRFHSSTKLNNPIGATSNFPNSQTVLPFRTDRYIINRSRTLQLLPAPTGGGQGQPGCCYKIMYLRSTDCKFEI